MSRIGRTMPSKEKKPPGTRGYATTSLSGCSHGAGPFTGTGPHKASINYVFSLSEKHIDLLFIAHERQHDVSSSVRIVVGGCIYPIFEELQKKRSSFRHRKDCFICRGRFFTLAKRFTD